MPKFNFIKTNIKEQREIERLRADVEINKAHNDYIAMMCDIDLPGAGTEESHEE